MKSPRFAQSALRFILLVAGLIHATQPATAATPSRPNVLLILSDDQRPDTISALGNPAIRTPTLDRLVARGTVLSGMNCAYPVCIPSRAEMLTGRTFMQAAKRDAAPPPTLPESLRRAGYRTWLVGKWHATGLPRDHGFDDTRGMLNVAVKGPVPPLERDHRGNPITGYRGANFQDSDGNAIPGEPVGLTPDISAKFATAAIKLIQRKPAAPFFLQLNFTAPHDPRFRPPGFERAYPAKDIPLPKNFAPTQSIDLQTRDERLLPKPLDPTLVRDELSIYYALISDLDAQVGRVLDALKQTGQLDNTIVIYTSDHGLALGSHGLLGKQNLYDHTLLVPCILAGPGIPRSVVRPGQAYLRDLSATILDLCGVAVPAGWSGVTLRPLIAGKVAEVHPFVVGYYLGESRAVRTPEWKLITFPANGRDQLFHLRADPHEQTDLATDPKHAPTLADMHAKLKAWATTHGLPGNELKLE